MKITQDASSLFAGSGDLSSTPTITPTASDANLFTNAMNDESDSQPILGGVLHHATAMFDQVSDEKNRIDTTMRRAAKSTDPMAMNKVESQLSNYYLENMMNTKIVSKAVQSLDKITNLQ